MSELGDAISEIRTELAGAASEFMPGTCSITKNPVTDGGAFGDTLTPTAGVTGIPYKYKAAGNRNEITVGGESRVISHWLTMPFTAAVLAIKPEDRIRDDADATIIFQEPIVVYDSTSVFVKVAAMMVQN